MPDHPEIWAEFLAQQEMKVTTLLLERLPFLIILEARSDRVFTVKSLIKSPTPG